jgi:hypothetical protein
VGCTVPVPVARAVGVRVAACVAVAVTVRVAVTVPVAVIVDVAIAVPVFVALGVPVGVLVFVGVTGIVAVTLAVIVRVLVIVAVAVSVWSGCAPVLAPIVLTSLLSQAASNTMPITAIKSTNRLATFRSGLLDSCLMFASFLLLLSSSTKPARVLSPD